MLKRRMVGILTMRSPWPVVLVTIALAGTCLSARSSFAQPREQPSAPVTALPWDRGLPRNRAPTAGERIQRPPLYSPGLEEAYQKGLRALWQGNHGEAMQLLFRAAEAGHRLAMFCVGYMYETGLGVAQDEEMALARYRQAATLGVPEAHNALGVLIQRGTDRREADPDRAREYFTLAARAGLKEAQYNLGLAALQQGASAPEAGWDWIARSAEQGFLPAMAMIGQRWLTDDDDAVRDRGLAFLRRAAKQGQQEALLALGSAYLEGRGVQVDARAAFRWLREAAWRGAAKGQRLLGELYRDGLGVPQDYVFAHLWFNLAASRGDDEAAERRDALAAKMTPDQLADAQKRARSWEFTYGRRRAGPNQDPSPARTDP